MRASIPPRAYASHAALVSFNREPSSSLEEKMNDTLMEDDIEIDSRFAIDVCSVEYKVDGFL